MTIIVLSVGFEDYTDSPYLSPFEDFSIVQDNCGGHDLAPESFCTVLVVHHPHLGDIGGLIRLEARTQQAAGSTPASVSMMITSGVPLLSAEDYKREQKRIKEANKSIYGFTADSMQAIGYEAFIYGVAGAIACTAESVGLCLPIAVPAAGIVGTAGGILGFLGQTLDYFTADPVDPNYTVITPPITPSLPATQASDGVSQRLADANNALHANLLQQFGLQRAILRCLDRAQGAHEAGDTTWESRQLVMAQRYAAQLAELVDAQPALQIVLHDALGGIGGELTITPEIIVQWQALIDRNGLPPVMADLLTQLGYDQSVQDGMRQSLLTADPLAVARIGGGNAVAALVNPGALAALRQEAQARRDFTGDFAVALSATVGGTAAITPATTGYAIGSTATLTATPDDGYIFTGWTIDGGSGGIANPLTLTMNANHTIVTTFGPKIDVADVTADYWAHDQVGLFAARGITTGCGDDEQGRRLYCPERGITRAGMATFITRTLWQDKVAPPATPTFADVPTDYWAYAQIEVFAQMGITTGYGVNELGQRIFCPDCGVTRAEMAAFIDRAKGQAELSAGTTTFADVPPDYWAYGWIERFFTLGVTTGCDTDDAGNKVYCPDRGVTRAEMVVFIIRAYP